MSHMSGPDPRMPGESIPGKETRGTERVVATDLSNKDEQTAQENSEVETDLDNNVTETVEEIKYLETMKVLDESSKT